VQTCALPIFPFRYSPWLDDPPADAATVALGVVAATALAAFLVRASNRMRGGSVGPGERAGFIAALWIAAGLAPAVLSAAHPVSSQAVSDRQLYAVLPAVSLAAVLAISSASRIASRAGREPGFARAPSAVRGAIAAAG